MDVEIYLNKLLVNEALRPKILKNYMSLVRTLSHPAYEIIKQLQFDLNLIESESETTKLNSPKRKKCVLQQ